MSLKFSKKVTCLLVTMIFMLTCFSTTALASAATKNVTYDTTYTLLISPSDFPKYMSSASSYVPQTYRYKDRTHQGTLNLTLAYCSPPSGMVGNYMQIKIHAKYSGTVTVLVPSKSVTYEKTYTFRIKPSLFPNYMSSPSSYVPPVYYYNDGNYSGYIYLSYAACLAPYSAGDYLDVRIATKYSGTVVYR